MREFSIQPGDRVLVKNVKLRGNRKLADKWESDVYLVEEQCGEMPIYKVRPETGDGPQWTLHRNMILPSRFTPEVPEVDHLHYYRNDSEESGQDSKATTSHAICCL